jgi:hypothetical protein
METTGDCEKVELPSESHLRRQWLESKSKSELIEIVENLFTRSSFERIQKQNEIQSNNNITSDDGRTASSVFPFESIPMEITSNEKQTSQSLTSESNATSLNANQMKLSNQKSKKKKKTKGREIDFTEYSIRHIALLISYVGTHYHGMASQVCVCEC